MKTNTFIALLLVLLVTLLPMGALAQLQLVDGQNGMSGGTDQGGFDPPTDGAGGWYSTYEAATWIGPPPTEVMGVFDYEPVCDQQDCYVVTEVGPGPLPIGYPSYVESKISTLGTRVYWSTVRDGIAGSSSGNMYALAGIGAPNGCLFVDTLDAESSWTGLVVPSDGSLDFVNGQDSTITSYDRCDGLSCSWLGSITVSTLYGKQPPMTEGVDAC